MKVSSGLMLWRSAPEAKRTVAPRRAAAAGRPAARSAADERTGEPERHARKVSARARPAGLPACDDAGDCPMLPLARRASAPSASCRRGDADVLPAATRARRSRAPSRGPPPRRNSRGAAQALGLDRPLPAPVRRLARPVRSGDWGTSIAPADRSAVCSPRPGPPPFGWWGSRSC